MELPVPVVLVALWMLGAVVLGLVLGAVLVVAFWGEALLVAAVALA